MPQRQSYAHRPSQAHQATVITRDGRAVPNLAYTPAPEQDRIPELPIDSDSAGDMMPSSELSEQSEVLGEIMAAEYEELTERLGEPIHARTRWVWLDPENNRVIKMAHNDEGLLASTREVRWSTIDQDPYINRTTWFQLDPQDEGSGTLVQAELVEPLHPNDPRVPDWAASIDCGQVGLTRDGRIVAYDV